MAGLKDEKEKEHFTRHLTRYVKIYMPDCPFEVTTTNRYTITDHEASVKARKQINPREEIKYLTGVQVAMTEEQEKTLELARKDFSLVISSRKKTRSLFLGPARFANHDCDANARLSTKGYDGMQIVAVKPIDIGDEITVSYGEDYFGDDNEECLCQTCETRQVNGWAPYKSPDSDDEEEPPTPAEEQALPNDDSYSFRKKRKYDSGSADNSPESAQVSKRAKAEDEEGKSQFLSAQRLSPTKRRVSKPLREATLKKTYSCSSLRQEVPVSSIEDPTTNLPASPQLSREIRTQQRVGLLAITLDETVSSRGTTPPSSGSAGSPNSFQSTDATSVDEETPVADDEIKDTIAVKPSLGVATVRTEETTVKTAAPSILDDDSSSELSELSYSYELDDIHQQIIKRKLPPGIRTTRSQSRYTEKNRIGTPVVIDPIEAGLVENPRKPGDYMSSEALLSAKYSKWVECHTCEEAFVQPNGYQTRMECPRCERHSKLYGYPWPKTDKEGKHDKEERVLDHRTVHRFVDPDEEKLLSKGKKARNEFITTRHSTPRSDLRESSISTLEPDSGPRRRRFRKTM